MNPEDERSQQASLAVYASRKKGCPVTHRPFGCLETPAPSDSETSDCVHAYRADGYKLKLISIIVQGSAGEERGDLLAMMPNGMKTSH